LLLFDQTENAQEYLKVPASRPDWFMWLLSWFVGCLGLAVPPQKTRQLPAAAAAVAVAGRKRTHAA
jgi:hypothetical protein